MEKVDGFNVIKPECLPPTTEAMTHHSYRVYHQVQTWLGNVFPVEDWSWTVRQSEYYPVLSNKPPAPDYLLKYVRCQCKEDGYKAQLCSCRKYGVPCTVSCKQCNGVSCFNSEQPLTDEDDPQVQG